MVLANCGGIGSLYTAGAGWKTCGAISKGGVSEALQLAVAGSSVSSYIISSLGLGGFALLMVCFAYSHDEYDSADGSSPSTSTAINYASIYLGCMAVGSSFMCLVARTAGGIFSQVDLLFYLFFPELL